MAVHSSKPGSHGAANATRKASGKSAPHYRGTKVSVASLPQHEDGNEVCGIGGPWPTKGGGTPARDKLGENKASDKKMGPLPNSRQQR